MKLFAVDVWDFGTFICIAAFLALGVALVIRQLREYGNHKAWKAAQELRKVSNGFQTSGPLK